MKWINSGLRGQMIDRTTPSLVQGADSFVVVQARNDSQDEAYNFQNLSGCTAYFPKTDGSYLSVVGAEVAGPYAGTMRFELGPSDTAALATGDNLSFEVDFVDDAGLTKLIMADILSVIAALYSGS